jgi:excinuclease UvrABC nuclease subunit
MKEEQALGGPRFVFTKEWIEKKAANADGVYAIFDRSEAVIYIGQGNIRERLLSHWNKENFPADRCVWNAGPYAYAFEECDTPLAREAELLRIHNPRCNTAIPD